MRVRLVGTTLLAVTLVAALAASALSAAETALVTVVAEAGGPVSGLTAKDFVVREDKATREVVAADASTEPLFITLLVDTTQPPMGILPPTQDLRRALASFVTIIKGGEPRRADRDHGFAGASVTAVDFTPRRRRSTSSSSGCFRTARPTPSSSRRWSTPARSSATGRARGGRSCRSTSTRATRAPRRR